jgi:hypothetical protein
VRSEVQIFPGPPNPAVAAYPRVFANWRGAIAQLGERLLCKQEVVGSIPSGSTSGDPVGQPLNDFRPRTSRAARPKTNPRLAKRPVHGTSAMRVLSDIVKRRSFRANVAALAAVFCALLMTCSIAATIHRPMSQHVHVGEA